MPSHNSGPIPVNVIEQVRNEGLKQTPEKLPASILVVDDEQSVRLILLEYLEMEGYDVSIAESASQALDLFDKHTFDLVLTDMKMPGMGGLELIEELKSRDIDTIFILMTGFGSTESAIVALRQGVYDYITKPFDIKELSPIIQRAIENRNLEKENVQLKELVNLYQLSELLTTNHELENILEQIAEVVRSEFKADGLLIVSKDVYQEQQYLLLKGYGIPTQAVHDWTPSTEWLTKQLERDYSVCFHDERAQAIFPNVQRVETLCSFLSVPMKVRGDLIGMFNLYSFSPDVHFHEGQRKALFMFASHAAATIENVRIYSNMKHAFAQTIEGFARALEAKDTYTSGHSDRVSTYAIVLAEGMNLSDAEIEQVRHAALLHDIGKLGIRNEDLNKPQKLTQAEYVMFQSHPRLGSRILEPLDFLHELIPAVAYHHEQWDGSGYPEGLKGEDIPIIARIIAVADTYDAMTSDRAYRKAMSHELAIEELQRCSGSQFDPSLVDIFCSAIEVYRDEQVRKGLLKK